MQNTIVCPKCGEKIEINEAIRAHLTKDLNKEFSQKHKEELERVRQETLLEANKKAERDFELKIKLLSKEKEEELKRNNELSKQLEGLNEELRALRRKDEERELAMKKQLADEEEKIRQEARKNTLEEHTLFDREKDKKLQDALMQIEELKKRMQQGSQQMQGEVLELELEELLAKEFPDDKISEVKKGQRGADIVQEVVDKKGRSCGTILWETKHAKWTDSWLVKFREDQREARAQLAVLVSVELPKDIETFTYKEGVWITKREFVTGLALALRFDLVHINVEKQANRGKNEKMEELYQYLRGTEFKHRIEGLVEAFTILQEDIEREKRWFTLKWARQEKEIRKIIDNTHGMYGELQAVTGRQLPEVSALTEEKESKDQQELLE